MNLLTDMWLLATRNLTMTALCIVYWLASIQWPVFMLFLLPMWFHLSGALMRNDLMLRKTYAGKWIWGITAILTLFLLVVAMVKVWADQPTPEAAEVFDYRDVISFLISSIAGFCYIGLSAWAASPNLSYTECHDAWHETAFSKEALKPALLIGLLYAISVEAPNGEWVISVCILASSAWVLRYMLGTPPERKKAFKTAMEGA
jgi:hypothetical protein